MGFPRFSPLPYLLLASLTCGCGNGSGTEAPDETDETAETSDTETSDTDDPCPDRELDGWCFTVISGDVVVHADGSLTSTTEAALLFDDPISAFNGGVETETFFAAAEVLLSLPPANEARWVQFMGFTSSEIDNMWGQISRNHDNTMFKSFGVNQSEGPAEGGVGPFSVADPDGPLQLKIFFDRLGSPQVTVFDPETDDCSGADGYDDLEGETSQGNRWGIALSPGVTLSKLRWASVCS